MATFADLLESEQLWLASQLEATQRFVGEHSPGDEWNPFRLEPLDRAWTHWMANADQDLERVNEAINAIGIGFGSILVETGIFGWTIATDDYGTDLAIRALPERGDVLVYPANFVSKRWERKETDFLAECYEDILRIVEKTKADWASR